MAYDVVVIDDDEDVAVLLETMLGIDERFRVAGSARTAPEGVRLAGELQPAVVVLDLHLPGMAGMDAIPLLRRVARCPIVVFSAFPDPITLIAALERGADGYVDKAQAWAELLPTLAEVCGALTPAEQE